MVFLVPLHDIQKLLIENNSTLQSGTIFISIYLIAFFRRKLEVHIANLNSIKCFLLFFLNLFLVNQAFKRMNYMTITKKLLCSHTF